MAACVLVVEDERKIRDMLRDYLEHDGLDVITTGSGAEAIKLARQAAPDLILLDLRLPDVPGEEVAREVRAVSQTPIMMLTAKTDPLTELTAAVDQVSGRAGGLVANVARHDHWRRCAAGLVPAGGAVARVA